MANRKILKNLKMFILSGIFLFFANISFSQSKKVDTLQQNIDRVQLMVQQQFRALKKTIDSLQKENSLLKNTLNSLLYPLPSLELSNKSLSKVLGSKASRLIISQSKVYGCEPDWNSSNKDSIGKTGFVGYYKTHNGFTLLDSITAIYLKNIIGSDQFYKLSDITKMCTFFPSVAFRFTDNKDRLDIIISFSCNEAEFYFNGKYISRQNFDNKRTELLQLSKRIFPNNNALKDLK